MTQQVKTELLAPRPELLSLNCPPAMRRLEGWVLWRFEDGDGPKPRKVPYYADGGRRRGVQGAREDRLRMVAFDAARSAAARRGFDGIGLCLLPEFGVVCIDFDNVVGPDGLRPDVAAVVSDTFAEFSPSGKGVHAYYLGNLGNHKSHGEPFGLETFSTSGFVTFTGNPLPHVGDLELAGPVDLVPVNQGMRSMYDGRFGVRAAPGVEDDDPFMGLMTRLELTGAEVAEALEVLDPDLGHDEWLRVGMALHHELGEDGFTHWDQWSAGGSKYPGTEVLQGRWDSFGRRTKNPVTGASLVKMANKAGARLRTSPDVFKAGDLAGPAAPAGEAVAPVKALRFPFVQAAQYIATRKSSPWLIKRVLPHAEVGVIFGESGAGKSFFALDLVTAVAQGTPWRGHQVAQGAVAYVCAEGAGGFALRLQAMSEFHGVDLAALALHVLAGAPSLLEKRDVADLVASLRQLPGLALVVIDTLAQVTAGANENGGEDMGRALAHCRTVNDATGAMVLLVAHAGKDISRGIRGWSGIKGALDVEILVEKSGKHRAATITKVKDGDGENDEHPFTLESVVLGQDEDGDDITSCVVKAAASVPKALRKVEPKGAVQKLVLRVADSLTDLPGDTHQGVLLDAVVDEMPVPEEGKRDYRRKNAMRAVEEVVAAGLLSLAGGVVTVLNKAV